MTDQEYVSAVVERLRRAAEDLLDILEHPGSEFQERLRRWKQRTKGYIKAHVSDDEADRFENISLAWDPVYGHSFDDMLGEHRAFLTTLADEIADRPGEVLNPTDVAAAPVMHPPPSRIFISHAAPDKPLALAVHDELSRYLPDARIFVSSRPGHISTGTSWWERITNEIRLAEGFVVLLTPASVERPWIAFETGAAWFSKRPLLTLTHGIEKAEVPWPMQGLQLASVSDPDELSQALTEVGVTLDDPAAVAARLEAIAPVGSKDGWVGVESGGRYFAWAGPGLHSLPDWDAEPAPPGLLQRLQDETIPHAFARMDNLQKKMDRGIVPVYETDRRSFRRRLWGVGGEQVLVVRAGDR